ncbi:LysR substrate-binding domain-containing protein [Streptomyces atratus]|uniref:LysR family substrate-binding domain-containing protein n=1 Tax=Streptomyces atratus TaxID=1893 RepID=UPI0038690B0F
MTSHTRRRILRGAALAAAGSVVGGYGLGHYATAAQAATSSTGAGGGETSPFLEGAFAPVTEELTAFGLEVTGRVPRDLDGRYLRTGPNALGIEDPRAHHWMLGDPGVHVISREGTTPALARALRAGSIALALLASAPPFRAPDTESPPLVLQTLTEHALRLAVPTTHPLARGDFVAIADLRGQQWIAGSSSGADRLMGLWPGLDERPEIVDTARDWMAKLHLVAAGCGLTTVTAAMASAAPSGVRILPVRGGPQELRRLLLARIPEPPAEPVIRLAAALRTAALNTTPCQVRDTPNRTGRLCGVTGCCCCRT